MEPMRKFRLPSLVALIGLTSACMTPPPRSDAFAALDAQAPSAFKNLNVALVLSPDTVAAGRYLDGVSSNHMVSASIRQGVDEIIPSMTRFLQGHFKSVVKYDSVEAAKAAPADVVAVLDMYAKLAQFSGMSSTIDAKLVFLDRDGNKIEAVEGHGKRNAPFPMYSTRGSEATADAIEQMTTALAASLPLKALDQAHSAAPSAAPAAPVSAPAIASDVDRPSYQADGNANDFAIVVGIESYENLPQASYAKRDATAVRNHLVALGYPERNIMFLTDERAGKSSIEKYVETWLPRNVGPDSKVFVYFSGHGAPDPQSGQAYLVPWDGDPKYLEDTGYPIKRLFGKLNALPAKQVIVAMDSCFSGAGGRSVLASGLRPLVNKLDVGAKSVGKLAVLAASGAEEVTGTDDSQGHGLFTYYLLKGLNAKSGRTTVNDLYGYLRPKVADQARRDNRDQTPQLLIDSTGAAGSLFLN